LALEALRAPAAVLAVETEPTPYSLALPQLAAAVPEREMQQTPTTSVILAAQAAAVQLPEALAVLAEQHPLQAKVMLAVMALPTELRTALVVGVVVPGLQGLQLLALLVAMAVMACSPLSPVQQPIMLAAVAAVVLPLSPEVVGDWVAAAQASIAAPVVVEPRIAAVAVVVYTMRVLRPWRVPAAQALLFSKSQTLT
jgi:hypothetical protein